MSLASMVGGLSSICYITLLVSANHVNYYRAAATYTGCRCPDWAGRKVSVVGSWGTCGYCSREGVAEELPEMEEGGTVLVGNR